MHPSIMSIRSSFLKQSLLASAVTNDGVAPDWVQIFPAGPDIETSDGRSFKISNPKNLVQQLNTAAQSVLVDYDHRSHYKVDEGGSSEAAGWLHRFETRDGGIWGQVAWAANAAAAISSKLYRFISPEFTASIYTGEVTGLAAVGLVNRPAFDMVALASKQKEDPPMLTEIAKALGLEKNADLKTVLAAIEKNTADHKTELAAATAQASTPSTDTFMPRADYDTVLARATVAEEKVAAAHKETFGKKVETMIASAVTAGKITPASKSHYIALCASEETYETTRHALAVSPEVIGKSEIKGQPDAGSHLTSEQKSMAATLGIAEDAYAKTLAADAA